MMRNLLLSKKIGIFLIVLAMLLVVSNTALGQISTLNAWTNVYHNTSTSTQNIPYTIATGSNANRLLVVAIASSRTSAGSRTVTLTYGGQTLTPVNGDMSSTIPRQHSQLYYLNETGLDAAATTILSVRVSGGTTRITDVFATVFDGVDQSSPITDSQNYSSGTSTTANPVFGTALTVNANDQAIEIISCMRTGSTTLRTITYASNWTMATQQTYQSTDAVRNAVVNRSVPLTNTTDVSSTTFNSTALASMTAMSLNAAGPNLSATPISSGFGDVCLNTTAGPQNFTISGTNLTTANITVSSLSGYTFCTTSGGTYSSSLSLAQGGGSYSQTIYVKFTPTSIQSYDGNIAIGGGGATSVNVAVTGAGITLPDVAITPVPTDAATSVCYAGSGAVTSVSWAAVSGATSYDVYFGAGSLPGSVTSNVATNSYNTGTLLANTVYYWKVVPKNACGNATGVSTWSFTTKSSPCASYCSSSGDMLYLTSITRVLFNTIDNASAKPSGYSDYTSISTDVNVNSSYNLTVNLNTDGNFIVYAYAWIDWNQNGSFTDSGEAYYLGSATNVPNGSTSLSPLSIAVPSGASLGNTRIRISAKYNGTSTSCETAFDGEVEDYTLNILSSCTNGSLALSSSSGTDSQTVCNNTSISDITYTIGGGATGATVTGLPAGVSGNLNGGNFTISGTPTATGNFTYTVNTTGTPSPCTEASSIGTITVNALPATPTITAGGSTTFCAGGSVTLTSSAGTSYLWSTGATTASINVTTAGSYTVQVTNASGCQSAASAATVVTVNALPAIPTITAGGSTTFCTGGSVTLTSSAGTSYLWSTGATTASINVTTAGSYTVQVTNASGCQSAASAATVVTVNPLPTPGPIVPD